MDLYNEQNLSRPKAKVATPPPGSKPQLQSPGLPSALVSAPVSPLTVPAPPATRIRRRNRMITSCLECRRRKLKCDKSHPCSNCTKATRTCTFLAPALDQASQLKLTEIKEKVGSLERLLERDVAHPTISSHTERALPDDADDYLPGAEDEKDLEPSPLAVGDAVYDDDAGNADDEMLDLGIRIGKMRITERIGGFFRPKISQEIEYTLKEGINNPLRDSVPIPNQGSSQSPPDYLKPGSNYIAPASGFFFGCPVYQASLIDFLPSRLAADRLINQYFTAVHPIAQIVHRPSFEKEYQCFWEEVSLGIEPSSSAQTIVFAAMFSGVVSMDESVVVREFGVAKVSLVENLKLGTETALGRANFLRTTKVETLQAFIMYLITLCRDEVSRAHSVLVGAAIRMAECMGLHRDGESYGLNPLETHVRRLIWHQICFLDVRTCEAQGPRPTIRRDDFDTKLPLNIDDVDLHPTMASPSSVDRWTDVTFSLIRFESNEMMRSIWVDRPRIERRKISLTAVLSKIETFRRNMAAKYDHLIDERFPIQRCAKMVKSLLLARLHVMTLHRYHNAVTHYMPDRLRDILITSGTVLLENAVALEVTPEVQQWKWYVGAYNQYHVAFLLLVDLYFYPTCKQADRIWPCLDYVFETNRSEPRDVRARKILEEVQQKTASYQQMRKMRAPSSMHKHLGQRPPKKIEDDGGLGVVGVLGPEIFDRSATTIGRAPLPDVVYAGISNGETLWALPNQGSPGRSGETSSMAEQKSPLHNDIHSDDIMADIDWEAFDQLFPPDQLGNGIATSSFDGMGPGVY